MMEKEQEMLLQNHVRVNLEMTHHHHDHERYDQVRGDQEQMQFDTLSISELVRGVCGIERKDHNHREAPQPMGVTLQCLVQKERSWMSRERRRQFSW